MFKKKTEEEINKEFMEKLQQLLKKYKRGLQAQISVIKDEEK